MSSRMGRLPRRMGAFVAIVVAGWLDDVADSIERRSERAAALSERLYPTSEILADVERGSGATTT